MTIKYFFAILILFLISSCVGSRKSSKLKTFSNSNFKISTISRVKLAGVDVQKIQKFSELSLEDIAKLSKAVYNDQLPLSLSVNMKVVNPTKKTAALTKFDWVLYIDDIEMDRGEFLKRVEIPSEGSATLPLKMEVYLKKILKGREFKSLVNFGLNLTNETDKPNRITIKVKPTMIIGSEEIVYPDYLFIR